MCARPYYRSPITTVVIMGIIIDVLINFDLKASFHCRQNFLILFALITCRIFSINAREFNLRLLSNYSYRVVNKYSNSIGTIL